LFVIVGSAEQPHVATLTTVYAVHVCVDWMIGFPFGAGWWFSNTLGWIVASVVVGCVRLQSRAVWDASGRRIMSQ
jgi:hypothetical protein